MGKLKNQDAKASDVEHGVMLPEQKKRVETGVIQFGNDWPGVFIRGDNCAWWSIVLSSAIEELPNDDEIFSTKKALYELKRLLDAATT